MGERKGQNHYYPPDFNYKVHKNLNKYHGTHALRERASRIHEGILRIRFEMPFNIWCLGCNNHVAMGVRFNADKKRVGMYYTTPLFEFRMKCHLCTNHFVIRTDPKNFDYELVEGCRRQENRFDPSTIDNLAPVDRTLNLRLSADAMYKAEHTAEDKKQAASVDNQIEKLEQIQSRLFDDYGANSYLRNQFRREKTDLNEHRAKDQAMKSRLSTEIALLPELQEDQIAAERLLKYRNFKVLDDDDPGRKKAELLSTPMFQKPSTETGHSRLLLETIQKEKQKKTKSAAFGLFTPPSQKDLMKTAMSSSDRKTSKILNNDKFGTLVVRKNDKKKECRAHSSFPVPKEQKHVALDSSTSGEIIL